MSRGTYRGLGKLGGSSIELALKYHVSAIRYGKHHQITEVRHVQFGWMPLSDYYLLQKLHDLLPLVQTVFEAGYKFKAWIWAAQVDVEILGTGVKVPFGAVLTSLIGIELGYYQLRNSGLQASIAQWQTRVAEIQAQIVTVETQTVIVTPGSPSHDQKGTGYEPGTTGGYVPETQAQFDQQIADLKAQLATVQGQISAAQAEIASNDLTSFALVAAAALPFGELWLIWHYSAAILGGIDQFAKGVASVSSGIGSYLQANPGLETFLGLAAPPFGVYELGHAEGWW